MIRAGRPQSGELGKTGPASFAFILCEASAPKFHQNKSASRNETVGPCLRSHPEPRVCRRYSGANSIASALHRINGRDPAENPFQSKSELPTAGSKPDVL